MRYFIISLLLGFLSELSFRCNGGGKLMFLLFVPPIIKIANICTYGEFHISKLHCFQVSIFPCPFAVETFGTLGEEALQPVSDLGGRLRSITGDSLQFSEGTLRVSLPQFL
jgi:hypothetical protein